MSHCILIATRFQEIVLYSFFVSAIIRAVSRLVTLWVLHHSRTRWWGVPEHLHALLVRAKHHDAALGVHVAGSSRRNRLHESLPENVRKGLQL